MGDSIPPLKNYPRRDESELEDLTTDEAEEDRLMEGRKPDLGEIEEDTSEL